jgi:hypothetical protein
MCTAGKKSIDSFWARQAGTAFTLTGDDLLRVKELGKPIPPESPNTRLVGSRCVGIRGNQGWPDCICTYPGTSGT